MIDYSAILARRFPECHWYQNGDDYSGIVWVGGNALPSRETLDALWQEVKTEIDNEIKALEKALDSAVEKLSAIGLNPIEIKALLGF